MSQTEVKTAVPYADYGCEKMIYDVRMGPQAVEHEGVIYCVYHGGKEGPEGHPHIRSYDIASRTWSDSHQIGRVSHYDHHFAPVLWFDAEAYLHVLYNCHGRTSTHIVSEKPETIDRWKEAPEVAPSISYPRVYALKDGRHLMYSRTFGHMGYWTFRLTEDGGFTWIDSKPLIDFDQNPQSNKDLWAGSYESAELDADGTGLHIGFVYLDEQVGVRKHSKHAINPLYNQVIHTNGRHHLHYAHLDFDSGGLRSFEGEFLHLPVNRSAAERLKIVDTGWRMTNPPAMANDDVGNPCFLLPASGNEGPWRGHHEYVRRVNDEWVTTSVAPLNSTWDGNLLIRGKAGEVTAIVATGDHDGSSLPYGGGTLEVWASTDDGSSWSYAESLVPGEGMICNNPKLVMRSSGEPLNGYLTFFGWQGGSLTKDRDGTFGNNRGRAYLWHDGEWL